MKKILTIFSLLLSTYFLFGCSSYESSGNDTSIQRHNLESSFQNDEIEKDIIQSEDESSISIVPNSINIQTPLESNSYLFDSYNDLSEALTEQEFYKEAGSNTYGELFDKTITAFKNNTIDLYVPAIDEDVFKNGTVQAYVWNVYDVSQNLGAWNLLPFVYPLEVYLPNDQGGQDLVMVPENMRFEWEKGAVTLIVQDLDGYRPVEIAETLSFRISVIKNM